ncbi:unnamed protein product [Rhizoctonia solani]|uniref:Uncharacterized protein n=1 Tax=Rhizoctonia solani TaxID=456999 RepID=A0A8H2WW11_9AGAM|nr:unnamed protein product [Rhizoctonia solani]
MSNSDVFISTQSSRSRSRSSTSRSRTASSTSLFTSTASGSNIETATFVPTTTSGTASTGLITASVPAQTETTSSLPAPTPTPTLSDNNGPSGPPVAAIVVPTILGVFVIGAVAFLLIFRRRRRNGSPYITRHEPKRRDTHPQPTIQESSLYLASKESENEKDSTPMSPGSSIDCDIMRSPRSKLRSSRASSSIFMDDRDDVTISSRSNYFRPLSLGEPVASRGLLQSPTSATSQPTPLFDRFNSNRVVPDRQLPTIPGTPATPRFAFFTTEEQDGERVIAQAQPVAVDVISLSRTTTRSSNHSSRSARFKTRNSTPPTPTASLPPLSPPPPIPLPPLPNSSEDLSKRVSTNTLSAPSRPGLMDSRPVSMQSAYSVQTQNLTPNYPGSLSPDILATLERLKKRISTPWSINSVDTYQFNRTTAPPTEEG